MTHTLMRVFNGSVAIHAAEELRPHDDFPVRFVIA